MSHRSRQTEAETLKLDQRKQLASAERLLAQKETALVHTNKELAQKVNKCRKYKAKLARFKADILACIKARSALNSSVPHE